MAGHGQGRKQKLYLVSSLPAPPPDPKCTLMCSWGNLTSSSDISQEGKTQRALISKGTLWIGWTPGTIMWAVLTFLLADSDFLW